MGESDEKDVEQAAARAESEADDLQRRADDVSEHIQTTREEWKRKRSDASVPGAVPPEDAD